MRLHTLLLCAAARYASSSGSARGSNTWYNYLGPANESEALAGAAYQARELLPFGYSSYTLDEGWAERDGALLLDANGLPEWNPDLYPAGLPALAASLRAMGLELGVWLMRGIPREAVAKKLPIANSSFTADQAARFDANCSWNSHTFGSNGSPAAAAYYASLAAKLSGWGLALIKVDCLWPHKYEGVPQPYFDDDVVGVSDALKAAGLALSMSPGISVTPANGSFIAAGGRAALYRIAEDVLDVYDSAADGSFPQGVHQKFSKALEFEALLGLNGTWPDFGACSGERAGLAFASRNLPHLPASASPPLPPRRHAAGGPRRARLRRARAAAHRDAPLARRAGL